jgi:hypothetical protein
MNRFHSNLVLKQFTLPYVNFQQTKFADYKKITKSWQI